ncbi:hypothetical protein L873DRAFT_1785194 [Choiromyces venosus 120613-1]|uniref:Uncharacterized protein n=1 Tax=Choiromyces venosus 120613-1 TaxID=1336337 RepID=A0A3N4K9U5_9PEZI|nr:hypothetical protein L873DRAFT_1785194 [Choiromyces venosus 120613-1]
MGLVDYGHSCSHVSWVSGIPRRTLQLILPCRLTFERLLTQLNKPAWDRHCVSIRFAPPVPEHTNACGIRTSSELGVALPAVLFLAFPAYMMAYGYFLGQSEVEQKVGGFAPAICFAAGGMYCSAAVWGFIGVLVAGKFEDSKLYFLRWIPWGIAIGVRVGGELMVFVLAITQALFLADPNIYRAPPQKFTFPHMGKGVWQGPISYLYNIFSCKM